MKLVNSSERIIRMDGLRAGNHYEVRVQSISLSGMADSEPVSFETQPKPGDPQNVPTAVVAVICALCASFALVLAIALVIYR